MKKITLFLTLLISAFAMGQTPILTMISDGDCSGGNPKVVEIYADGAVDFANYSLEIQTNANTTWGNTLNLGDLGTVTDDFVYIHKTDASFATEYPSATNTLSTTTSAVNFNGDDRIRIVEDATSSVIDQYGAESTDGTGEAWEYKDGYAKRNNGSGPDSGFFAGNWSYYNGDLDGKGTCQGEASFESIIGIGSYSPTGGSNDPAVIINSPANNAVLDPGTTSVDVVFAAQNEPAGAQFDITVNGATTVDVTSPFSVSTADGENYTVVIELINGQSIAASDDISFSVADFTQVADITALRADVAANGLGRYYEITGDVTFTHADGYNNRKWFQDASPSGIYVEDGDDVIPNDAYSEGDLVKGLKGVTSNSNGVLTFEPVENTATISGSTDLSPLVLTLSEFNSNFEDYESVLVGFEDVSFTDADGAATFSTGSNYEFSDGNNDTSDIRTTFFGADYIGEVIPDAQIDGLVGLAAEYNGSTQIFSRSLSDMNITLSTNMFDTTNLKLYPNPVSNGVLSIETQSSATAEVEFFNMLGQKVLAAKASKHINVSSLSAGIYLVRVQEGASSQTKKIVIK